MVMTTCWGWWQAFLLSDRWRWMWWQWHGYDRWSAFPQDDSCGDGDDNFFELPSYVLSRGQLKHGNSVGVHGCNLTFFPPHLSYVPNVEGWECCILWPFTLFLHCFLWFNRAHTLYSSISQRPRDLNWIIV